MAAKNDGHNDDNKMSVEPVGIVISNGKRDEPTPAFWAYMWGPAPEQDSVGKTPRAA
ncbi:MAG TPA: hypothetical protein VLD17_16730 [Gemmatimonadaceae bacterium]|nr:hypothetical protein [Gemmatimonadaceae bacterium]